MPVFCEAVETDTRPISAELRCVACDCTEDNACPGGCYWISLDPPLCSACGEIAADLGLDIEATREPADSGLFGVQRCPASTTPAPHVQLWVDGTSGYCARCRQGFTT